MSKQLPPLRLIYAEDNPVNAKVFKSVIRAIGFDVDLVSDGERLIDALKKSDYDLAFVDISMPVTDGYEAALKIRAGAAGPENSALPLIAVTALDIHSDKSWQDVGMNAYIKKPVTTVELRNVLCEALGLPQLLEPELQAAPYGPLDFLVEPGSAPPEVIAELLSDLSQLYRLAGGSGLVFDKGASIEIREVEAC
ncbi:MAG: response regulator [Opitutales bacterium]